ncbi:SCO2322 family protein [Streptomyces albiaxialis]|uniref:SCO2322 family protein n=1 Tax=Streptomyces albiaxialis TaxID=329523 RepID=A0ABN2WAH6_9ACTN
MRRPRVLPALLGALLLAVPLGGTAQAADDGYRYWSFWERKKDDGGWAYATKGPSLLRPGDGDVLGFRFAVSEDSADATRPRGEIAFDAACARTEEKSGTKRVALRLDFGTRGDAPGGEDPPRARTACARIDEDGSAADALAAVAEPLRYNSDSLLCAIDGYPRKGCGEQASKEESKDSGDSSPGKKKDDDGGMSSGLGIAAGVAAVAVLGAAALWQARRRR